MAAAAAAAAADPSTYILVRVIFLRALAFVYAVAFTVALRQNKALVGDHGITPARKVLDRAQARGEARLRERSKRRRRTGIDSGSWTTRVVEAFRDVSCWDRRDVADKPVTTLLWLAKDRSNLNPWLDGIALAGITAALLMLILGRANVPVLLLLFVCQRSLWAVGGEWYAYAWERILAELGFHALFLVPPWGLSGGPITGAGKTTDVPVVVVWSLRWLLFRIMIGAGLIKLRGSRHWKEFTAMYYFYETQPVPNRLSKHFHAAPRWWHRVEVLGNHFVELVAPWLLLVPYSRPCRIAGGVTMIGFQAILILGGNLSFLNWLTAIPALFCFDDALVSPLFMEYAVGTASNDDGNHEEDNHVTERQVVSIAFGLLIAALSVPIVRNFLSAEQLMLGSFDPYQIVNTFGAFGTIREERVELIVSSAMEHDGEWREYDFPVKPGNTLRRPPVAVSPYHHRLDWQMWIASQFGSVYSSPWMYRLLIKLLEADGDVLRTLVAHDPWNGRTPKFIKVDSYRYKFSMRNEGQYWDREYVGRFFPRVGKGATLESLWRQADRTGF